MFADPIISNENISNQIPTTTVSPPIYIPLNNESVLFNALNGSNDDEYSTSSSSNSSRQNRSYSSLQVF